ncbi:hypothetical protein K431DRAFT_92968 [Polychaeton citri CBS 116435]|uniref:Uncharacterized protein n=1 Tax=Polychaeton citri CBS 116435 TaxID=1314669 RepID=A0A9P4Q958_9PEZI|nr:hypothetical protein K431DRAFT_92968 [Polychaeton citri CBS 116435]
MNQIKRPIALTFLTKVKVELECTTRRCMTELLCIQAVDLHGSSGCRKGRLRWVGSMAESQLGWDREECDIQNQRRGKSQQPSLTSVVCPSTLLPSPPTQRLTVFALLSLNLKPFAHLANVVQVVPGCFRPASILASDTRHAIKGADIGRDPDTPLGMQGCVQPRNATVVRERLRRDSPLQGQRHGSQGMSLSEGDSRGCSSSEERPHGLMQSDDPRVHVPSTFWKQTRRR